ncbi:MAG: TraI domain-containing protein [Cyanobacteriota bacterium]
MLNKEYVVISKEPKQTKQGKPFISMLLNPTDNKDLSIDAKIWSDKVEKLNPLFKTGDLIKIKDGKQETYNNNPQLIINDLEVIAAKQWGLSIEQSKDLYYCLLDFIENNINNSQLKEITLQTLQKYFDSTLLYMAPAAKSHHHNYPGGLLEHTMELCQIAQSIKSTNLYPEVSWDIVISACILHDLGKVYDYTFANGTIEITETLKLTGHLVTTPIEIYETAKAMGLEHTPSFQNLLHAVIAHHGKKEWGSPQEPVTKEAWLVHLIDMISSKISAQRF